MQQSNIQLFSIKYIWLYLLDDLYLSLTGGSET